MKTTKQIKKAYSCGRGVFVEYVFNEENLLPISETYYHRYGDKITLIEQVNKTGLVSGIRLWLRYRDHKNSPYFVQVKGTTLDLCMSCMKGCVHPGHEWCNSCENDR